MLKSYLKQLLEDIKSLFNVSDRSLFRILLDEYKNKLMNIQSKESLNSEHIKIIKQISIVIKQLEGKFSSNVINQ